jgi:hypothetical protein
MRSRKRLPHPLAPSPAAVRIQQNYHDIHSRRSRDALSLCRLHPKEREPVAQTSMPAVGYPDRLPGDSHVPKAAGVFMCSSTGGIMYHELRFYDYL